MKKYNIELEIIKRKISQMSNPIYKKATEACLEDLEKMLNASENQIPDISPTFEYYIERAMSQKENKTELQILYEKYINNFCDLLKVLNIKDALSIFCFYKICLADGMLSINNQFKYVAPINKVDNAPGTKIVSGKGNTKDINSFLVNIYKNLGFKAITLPCIVVSDECYTSIEAINETKNIENPEIIYITLVE